MIWSVISVGGAGGEKTCNVEFAAVSNERISI